MDIMKKEKKETLFIDYIMNNKDKQMKGNNIYIYILLILNNVILHIEIGYLLYICMLFI